MGNALRFGGSGHYATIAPHDDLASPSFTYSGWIRLDAYPRDWGVVFSNFDGDHRGWFAGVNSNGRVIVSIWGRPSSSSWFVSERRLETVVWRHLAVTFDDLSQQTVLYIDGKPDRSLQVAFTPQTIKPLTLARASWFDGYYLECSLDETRVFATALQPHAIRREFERFAPAAPAAASQRMQGSARGQAVAVNHSIVPRAKREATNQAMTKTEPEGSATNRCESVNCHPPSRCLSRLGTRI